MSARRADRASRTGKLHVQPAAAPTGLAVAESPTCAVWAAQHPQAGRRWAAGGVPPGHRARPALAWDGRLKLELCCMVLNLLEVSCHAAPIVAASLLHRAPRIWTPRQGLRRSGGWPSRPRRTQAKPALGAGWAQVPAQQLLRAEVFDQVGDRAGGGRLRCHRAPSWHCPAGTPRYWRLAIRSEGDTFCQVSPSVGFHGSTRKVSVMTLFMMYGSGLKVLQARVGSTACQGFASGSSP